MKEAMCKKHYLFLYEVLQEMYEKRSGVNTLSKKIWVPCIAHIHSIIFSPLPPQINILCV